MREIDFYFDFISPYSFLATQKIRTEAKFQDLKLNCRPITFGTILAKLDAKGPGEIPSRRRIGLEDVNLLCQHYGYELSGPPTHPFNSVYALRSVCDVEDEDLRWKLTERYFRAAWSEGKSLEDMQVLKDCLAEFGIEQDPEEAATTRENRAMLKRYTKEALAADCWGVPSFVVDGLVFFGHDRLDLLHSYVTGKVEAQPAWVAKMLDRPQPGRIT